MARQSEFLDYLLDQLAPLGVVARAMFGGFGLYLDGVFFAIVASDVLYLKTDEHNRGEFVSRACQPFCYVRNGERYSMKYFEAPAEVVDDPELLQVWVREAVDAALRSREA